MIAKHQRRIVRGLALACLVAGALVASAAPMQRQMRNPVRIEMLPLGGDRVEVRVTNVGDRTLRIPKWQLPIQSDRADLFRITRDGRDVAYRGAIVKRGAPTAEDFAILRPGRSIRSVVALGESYDFSKVGRYRVDYQAPLQFASLSGRIRLKDAAGRPLIARGAPIAIALDRPVPLSSGGRLRPVQPANPELSDVLGITTLSCNASQISSLQQAVLSARSYSERAKLYLNNGTVGPRYTTWFGTYTSSRYATVRQHFQAIDAAIDQTGGQVTIDCNCNEEHYAHVFRNDHYRIYVCNKFWRAPLAGTDSKAGTLIHELSHFAVVANTDDHAYTQPLAMNLAINSPDLAVDNADSHEYFAENTPELN